MRKKKKQKVVIMRARCCRGDYRHGVDLDGFQVKVPVGRIGRKKEGLPRGFLEYKI